MVKYLIINADDFGMSPVFNKVILSLLKKDYLCSTTVMVDRVIEIQKQQFKQLITLSKGKNLSIGLHLEFLHADYSSQIEFQYKKFREILGFNPSHIDIHKQHELKDSFEIVAKFCKDKNLPHRKMEIIKNNYSKSPKETFMGSISDFRNIKKWVGTLEENVFYEILFHPGRFDPNCSSSLNKDREQDVKHIKNLRPLLKAKDIKIVSYLDFTKFFNKAYKGR
jgi:predicted glycoside hydrolase/deacetylase ChbG (UPF0249 family)